MANVYQDIKKLKYKLVYLTPEKLVHSAGLLATMDYMTH